MCVYNVHDQMNESAKNFVAKFETLVSEVIKGGLFSFLP